MSSEITWHTYKDIYASHHYNVVSDNDVINNDVIDNNVIDNNDNNDVIDNND